ncbi:hypothetical protein K461DRAFT_69504 [Myriangium duriaei CBS 260.36]|uniref:Uncharacterized protein n=1 Tax=Myriangium duriaei CBS 260.36 TaxID=1168546 RepID=A0A9P4MCG2_9PEZI|nr:hypothetical protein K461DRAFT_69504 [Myriangium duriaei CBS 260.36]
MRLFFVTLLLFVVDVFAARVIYATGYKWNRAMVPIISVGTVPDDQIEHIMTNMDRWSEHKYTVTHKTKCRGRVHIITIRGPRPAASRTAGNDIIKDMKQIMQQHVRGNDNNPPREPGSPEDPPCPRGPGEPGRPPTIPSI